MAITYSDLKSEVKRRATKNQGGTQFDTGIGIAINTSLWRISRECRWRNLRRITTFDTVTSYTTGSGAVTVTNNSKNITVTGATFITNAIKIGRYVKFSGSGKYYKIVTITGETTFTIDQMYDGTTSSTATYSILPQEEYVLPIQIGHSAFLWHRAYGLPRQLGYTPDQAFYSSGALDVLTNIPVSYRMWGVDSILDKLRQPSVITIASSSSSDTNIPITIFGIVSGYPDYEIITTNSSDGTTSVSGSKTFSSVERITKNSNSTGRISCTANSGNTTIGVLPVGNTTSGPMYTKVQLYPLPSAVFPITVQYYKLPYMLVNDNDVSELGEEFSEAIILLSTAKLKAEQNQSEDVDYYKMYNDELMSLRRTNVDKIDWNPKLQSPTGHYLNVWTGGLRYEQVGSGGQFGPTTY